jgi:hypothetical protein
MKKIISLLVASSALIFLMQSSSQQSISNDALKINYQGMLNGQPVEHITINGLNQQIKFRIKPDSQTKNPSMDTKKIDLDLIKSITLPGGKLTISKYNGTDYVEIIVNYKKGGAELFLMETTKKIITKDKDGTERETFFPALVDLEITGVSCEKNKN